jgi:hypothetical protein
VADQEYGPQVHFVRVLTAVDTAPARRASVQTPYSTKSGYEWHEPPEPAFRTSRASSTRFGSGTMLGTPTRYTRCIKQQFTAMCAAWSDAACMLQHAGAAVPGTQSDAWHYCCRAWSWTWHALPRPRRIHSTRRATASSPTGRLMKVRAVCAAVMQARTDNTRMSIRGKCK